MQQWLKKALLFTYLNFRMARRTEHECKYWLGSNIAAWQAVFFKTLADSMVFAIANQKVAFAARLGAIGNKRLKHQNQTLNSWSTSMYTKQPGWNTFNCAAQQHVELTQWPYGAAGASCGLNHWSTMCWKVGVWLPVQQQLDQPVVGNPGSMLLIHQRKELGLGTKYNGHQFTMVLQLTMVINLDPDTVCSW